MTKSKMQATIYSLFLLTFNEHNHLDPNHSFADLFDVWEYDWNVGSSIRREDLTLIRYCLQMLNDKILKPNNEICLECEYQLKQKRLKKCCNW